MLVACLASPCLASLFKRKRESVCVADRWVGLCLVRNGSNVLACGLFALSCVLKNRAAQWLVCLVVCIGACFLIHARTRSVMRSISISVKLFGGKMLFVLVY